MAPYRPWWARRRNEGKRKDQHILNNKPVLALRTLSAGQMAGITSPGRRWFGFRASDDALNRRSSVRAHLEEIQEIIEAAFHSSNLYKVLSSTTWKDLSAFGTAAKFMELPKPDGNFMFRPMAPGQFWLDVDSNGTVDTCFRELPLTVRTAVEVFGAACSTNTLSAYDRGDYQFPVLVMHAVYPNRNYRPGALGPFGKKWASCWWEFASNDRNAMLRQGGYDRFPVIAPRWEADPSDAYGRGPGHDVVGDCGELQSLELSKLQIIDLIKKPSMQGSPEVRRGTLVAGALTRMPRNKEAFFKPTFQVDHRSIAEIRAEIAETEQRVGVGMYEPLWSMFSQDDRAEPRTATEVIERRTEKMQQMGSLLDSANPEMLEPLVMNAYAELEAAGRLPDPPEELQGQTVHVEFQSILHKAQEQSDVVTIQTLVDEIGRLGKYWPDVVDKFDADAAADELQRVIGARADLMRDQKGVQAARSARATAEQARQQGEAMGKVAEGMRNVSGVDPQQLKQLAATLSPAAAAAGSAA